ncbi:MAG TPA: hypothetical protein VEY08_13070, partial [Chloroflexia bacterium]|nr:hypothetical protein [Chloroflexia bacterium]
MSTPAQAEPAPASPPATAQPQFISTLFAPQTEAPLVAPNPPAASQGDTSTQAKFGLPSPFKFKPIGPDIAALPVIPLMPDLPPAIEPAAVQTAPEEPALFPPVSLAPPQAPVAPPEPPAAIASSPVETSAVAADVPSMMQVQTPPAPEVQPASAPAPEPPVVIEAPAPAEVGPVTLPTYTPEPAVPATAVVQPEVGESVQPAPAMDMAVAPALSETPPGEEVAVAFVEPQPAPVEAVAPTPFVATQEPPAPVQVSPPVSENAPPVVAASPPEVEALPSIVPEVPPPAVEIPRPAEQVPDDTRPATAAAVEAQDAQVLSEVDVQQVEAILASEPPVLEPAAPTQSPVGAADEMDYLSALFGQADAPPAEVIPVESAPILEDTPVAEEIPDPQAAAVEQSVLPPATPDVAALSVQPETQAEPAEVIPQAELLPVREASDEAGTAPFTPVSVAEIPDAITGRASTLPIEVIPAVQASPSEPEALEPQVPDVPPPASVSATQAEVAPVAEPLVDTQLAIADVPAVEQAPILAE